ncbi:MAG: protein kinase [Planctomycetota bacterium]
MLAQPKRFGPYDVISELARGGQGIVLRARHRELGHSVALKLLVDAADPVRLKRFRQEAKVLARLRHPHLARVTDLGELNQIPFLAMDLIEGRDLRAIVEAEGPPPLEWTARVLAVVAHTLHYCHEQGLVHRDLKPANVLIERDSQRPVLVDFGLVQRDAQQMSLGSLDQGPLSLSGEGLKGTPAYMAPEQAAPDRYGAPGPLADVYALGGTLYFLLTGQPPFRGESLVNVIREVIAGEPPDPRRFAPRTPPAVAALCLRCLRKQPAERPPDAAAFARELCAAAGVSVDVPRPDSSSGGSAQGSSPGAAYSAAASPPGGLAVQSVVSVAAAGGSIDGHQVREELGRGGMGIVYRVDCPDGRPGALKLLIGGSPRRRERFRREASVLSFLGRHPGIVSLLGSGEHLGNPYLVMELIAGDTLERRLERGAGGAQAVAWLAQVARAVHFAHEAGVVHRDLKPANVLIDGQERARVVDLGLAHDDQELSDLTKTGDLVGTIAYMAPEQLRGKGVDRRTDVYALGAMLYRALAGHVPFEGAPISVAARIVAEEPEPPGGDPALAALALAALAKDPAARPQSAEDFARALEGIAGGAPAPIAPPAPRGSRAPALLLGLTLGAALGAGALALGRGGGGGEASEGEAWQAVLDHAATGRLDPSALASFERSAAAANRRWLPLLRALSGADATAALRALPADPARDLLLAERAPAGEAFALLDGGGAAAELPWRSDLSPARWRALLARAPQGSPEATRACLRLATLSAGDERLGWLRQAYAHDLRLAALEGKALAPALLEGAGAGLERPTKTSARRAHDDLVLYRMTVPRDPLPPALLRRLTEVGLGPDATLREAALPGLKRWQLRPDEVREVLLTPLPPERQQGCSTRRPDSWPAGWRPFLEELSTMRTRDRVLVNSELLLWQPLMPVLWFRLGMNLRGQGLLRWSEHAQRLGRELLSADDADLDNSGYELAQALLEQQQGQEALALFEAVVAAQQRRSTINPWFLAGAVEACLSAGDPARALVHVDELARIWPDKAVTFTLRADALHALAREDEARAARERARSIAAAERVRR